MAFDFGGVEDMVWVRDQLRSRFGGPGAAYAPPPICQLVKSLISSRTRDKVSLGAYLRLVATYRQWSDLAGASASDVQVVIAAVTFPDVKARRLCATLRAIAACQPNFDLTFLGSLSVAEALAWLERLPGVGRKVAASTLNFSILNMPVFVVDTHVLRILERYGFVRNKARPRTACNAVMATLHASSAADLTELHVLMKHLGQTICHANDPRCPDCPLRRRCKAAASARKA